MRAVHVPLFCLQAVFATKNSAIRDVSLPNGRRVPLMGLGLGYGNCAEPDRFEGCDDGPGNLHPDRQADLTDFLEETLLAGVRLFDTAFSYGTERALGTAMGRLFSNGSLRRSEVFVVTKPPSSDLNCTWCALQSHRLDDLDPDGVLCQGGVWQPGSGQVFREGMCLEKPPLVSDALAESLERLGVDYVDGLAVHHLDVESEESLQAQWRQMEAEVDRGRALSLGISGVEKLPLLTERLTMLMRWARHLPSFVFYVSGDRRTVALPEGVGARVFAGGLVHLGEGLARAVDRQAAEAIALSRGVTARQVSLRAIAQTGATGPGPVVSQSLSLQHVIENLGAMDFALSETELADLTPGLARRVLGQTRDAEATEGVEL